VHGIGRVRGGKTNLIGKDFQLLRLAGIDVFIDVSLLVIFFLVAGSLAVGVLPSWHPDWGPLSIWLTAGVAAVLFLVSVLVHEMSHALVGRTQGVEIRRITLFIFGGMAQMEGEPRAWRAELWMALVGPLTSIVLGAACIALGYLIAGPPHLAGADQTRQFLASLSPFSTLLFWLGPVNVILGIFNLVPGFPLDGGRVLRAILWGMTGSLRRATRLASNAGQAFAWILIVAGLGMVLGLRVPVFGTGLVGGLWLALIGWFLRNAATMSYRQLLVTETLGEVPVSKLMQQGVKTIEPRASVRALVEEYLMQSDQRAYPVVEGGRLLGLVCLRDVRKVPRDEWERTRVEGIMTPASRLAVVSPDDDAVKAMTALSQRHINQLPVVDHDRVRGVIRREDIRKWITLYGDREMRAGH
jgi:Zn-dependent protease/predicted transcriptional regulator